MPLPFDQIATMVARASFFMDCTGKSMQPLEETVCAIEACEEMTL